MKASAVTAAIVNNPKVCDVALSPIGVLVLGDPGGKEGAMVGTQETVRLTLSPTGSNCDSGHCASESVE